MREGIQIFHLLFLKIFLYRKLTLVILVQVKVWNKYFFFDGGNYSTLICSKGLIGKRGYSSRQTHWPKAWASRYKIKHLCRVEQLFESAEELDTLIVSRLGVHKDKKRGAVLWSYCFPRLITSCKPDKTSVTVSVYKLSAVYRPVAGCSIDSILWQILFWNFSIILFGVTWVQK